MGLVALVFLVGAVVAQAGRRRPSAPRSVWFAGYTWTVKSSSRKIGPGPNFFSASFENVWVDASGRLHLAITREQTRWYAAEVIAHANFGYGTYRFTLETPVHTLDPNVVLGLFTWSDEPAFHHRELDVEFARWGNAADPTNAQYVVQPYDGGGNLVRFVQPPAGVSTHEFTWLPDRIEFASTEGSGAAGTPFHAWTYTGPDVPQPGDENPRINLWLLRGNPPQDGQPVEVVIGDFAFLP